MRGQREFMREPIRGNALREIGSRGGNFRGPRDFRQDGRDQRLAQERPFTREKSQGRRDDRDGRSFS